MTERCDRHAALRRLLQGWLGTALGVALAPLCGAAAEFADGTELARWIRHPLLVRTLYRHGVSRAYNSAGAAGANLHGYAWIEEQRQGAEWIVRGYAERKADWMGLGWQQLDWGAARQQDDGGFASQDAFHSTSFFVEALARSCLIDPGSASAPRRRLARFAQGR
jgi:hypothetical protein